MAKGWLRSVPVAHRGLHDIGAGVPENSRAAFRAAIAAGYAIECDVRLAADGVPVVFHDADLKRLTGTEGRTDALAASALSRLPLLGTAETPPLFDEFLALASGRAPLLIEIKNYGNEPAAPLCEAAWERLKGYAGDYAVQSFAPDVVAWFHERAPHVPRGQIATDPADLKALDEAGRKALAAKLEAGHGAPDFIAYDVSLLPAPLTERARAAGRPVLTWTVRTDEQRARAAAHADNVIFEGFRA
ncbi:glycerophosphodiester phosphodiesterase family protein [Desertibaculum subflavum]|uniref:glycerophosphodiester phosphodiesterase family protein n=1 Tax=Desertibaculum subflavum TaxID=2268458 RepID=UPI000E676458